jgi:hypothetical protein
VRSKAANGQEDKNKVTHISGSGYRWKGN